MNSDLSCTKQHFYKVRMVALLPRMYSALIVVFSILTNWLQFFFCGKGSEITVVTLFMRVRFYTQDLRFLLLWVFDNMVALFKNSKHLEVVSGVMVCVQW